MAAYFQQLSRRASEPRDTAMERSLICGSRRFGSKRILSFQSEQGFQHHSFLNAARKSSSSTCLVATCAVRQGGPEFVDEKERIQAQAARLETWDHPETYIQDAPEAFWDQLSLAFRVLYSLGLYAGLAFAAQSICNLIGIDCWGGLQFSPEVVLTGLGYAVPPTLALLLLQDDEIVKAWAPARAVREVEDGELMEYFDGMGWQFVPVVMAGALSEELFFRVAIQGGLAHAIQASASMGEPPKGLAALTAVVPSFSPFAQLFAVVLSAVLTGSMYYLITAPKDPTYVIAPTARGQKAFTDIRKRFEAWNQRRQMKKIYSPLVEALLALYLGTEWLQTSNILAPMITHLVYSNIIVGNGLLRMHYQRLKLRQRVASIAPRSSASATTTTEST